MFHFLLIVKNETWPSNLSRFWCTTEEWNISQVFLTFNALESMCEKETGAAGNNLSDSFQQQKSTEREFFSFLSSIYYYKHLLYLYFMIYIHRRAHTFPMHLK